MLKVIVKTINVVTAVYVVYVVVGTVYGMGKEAGKREITAESIPTGSPDENGNPEYKVINGVVYKRVDK